MKKIKLFALAVFAMLSTNVFAEGPKTGTGGNGYLQYSVEYTAGTPAVAEATVIGLTNGVSIPETIVIPNKVEITAKLEGDASASTYEYTVVGISATAFAGVTSFTGIDIQAESLVTIPASAFVGTNIATLDLSKTKVVAIDNWFTNALEATATNSKLESVKLYKNWTSIAASAFEGCSALAAVDFGTADSEDGEFAQVITAGAFAGSAIKTLDLSGTVMTTIPALFGTVIDATSPVKYSSLETVKLPATWTTIATRAFANCDKLATIDFGTAKATIADGGQTIGELALAGTAVTALDFSKTKVSSVPNNLLYDGTVIQKNTSLETVTINNLIVSVEGEVKTVAVGTAFANCEALTTFTGLDAATTATPAVPYFNTIPANAFKGDKLLATISTKTIKTFGNSAFEGCAALATIDLSAATTLGTAAFKGTALTEVTIPGTVPYVSESAFEECASIAKVTFGHRTSGETLDAFNGIGEYAFAGTKLASIVIPSTMEVIETYGGEIWAGAGYIDAFAFADCVSLKSFTYKPGNVTIEAADADTKRIGKVVDDNAFVGCNGVTFYTLLEYKNANPTAPKKSTYEIDSSAEDDTDIKYLDATISKKESQANAGRRYVKYKNGATAIKVKATDAKVYAAYVDDGTYEINMQMFRSKGGYYHIAPYDVVLMLTTLEKVPYQPTETAGGSSWLQVADANGDGNIDEDKVRGFDFVNQLRYVTEDAGIKRSAIEAAAEPETPDVYGWINNATYGYGFQHITSGSTFPKGTLYVLAKAPAEGAAARVFWRDENGNIEDETTAIQGIVTKSEIEDGASYNLAGQKVNASYKGVVIKNGKKHIIK